MVCNRMSDLLKKLFKQMVALSGPMTWQEWDPVQKAFDEVIKEAKLVPMSYDGGMTVHINHTILPLDGEGMDEDEKFSLRYTIQNTSENHWAIFADHRSSRLSKSLDEFVLSGLPSNRPDGFVEDTTWPTAVEAAEFLEKWRERELQRCEDSGFRKLGEPRTKQPILDNSAQLQHRIESLVQRRREISPEDIVTQVQILYREYDEDTIVKNIGELLDYRRLKYTNSGMRFLEVVGT